jgi:predicted secreted protein
MKNIILIFALLFIGNLAKASEHQMIDTLGVSPKGQYVALEEYGYKAHGHTYYVRIKIINVWKKEYVGKSVEVELPASHPQLLVKARARAKVLAFEELNRFQIRG